MKIKIYFKGKDIPNTVYNRYGQQFVDVRDYTEFGSFLIVTDLDGDMVSINCNIVAAVDISLAK